MIKVYEETKCFFFIKYSPKKRTHVLMARIGRDIILYRALVFVQFLLFEVLVFHFSQY